MGSQPQRRAELVALGIAIRTARLKQRWGQDDLAGAAGISTRYLSKVEQGIANPTVEVLLAIAEALGTTAAALLLSAEVDKTE